MVPAGPGGGPNRVVSAGDGRSTLQTIRNCEVRPAARPCLPRAPGSEARLKQGTPSAACNEMKKRVADDIGQRATIETQFGISRYRF